MVWTGPEVMRFAGRRLAETLSALRERLISLLLNSSTLLLIGFQDNDMLWSNNQCWFLLVLGSSCCILFGLNNNLKIKVESFLRQTGGSQGLV